MAEARPITIKSREVTGPHKSKDGKNSYMKHIITTTEGETINLIGFGDTGQEAPTVNKKVIHGLNAGAKAQIIGERNGKFFNTLDIAVIESAPTSSAEKMPWEDSSEREYNITESTPKFTTGAPTLPRNHVQSMTLPMPATSSPMNKDISIELSGLIQALIGTGHYHTVKQGEQGSQTFINDKLLEMHVQRILDTKDKLAQQRGNK